MSFLILKARSKEKTPEAYLPQNFALALLHTQRGEWSALLAIFRDFLLMATFPSLYVNVCACVILIYK